MSKRLVALLLVLVLCLGMLPSAAWAAVGDIPPGKINAKSVSLPLNISGGYEVTVSDLHSLMMSAINELGERFCITAVPSTDARYPYCLVIRSLERDGYVVAKNNILVFANAGAFTPENFEYGTDWMYYVVVPVEASTGIFTGKDASYVYQPGGGGFSSGGGGGRGGTGSDRPGYHFEFPTFDLDDVSTSKTSNVSLAPYDLSAYREIWFEIGLIKSDLSNCTVYTERDLRDICENLNNAGVKCRMYSRIHTVGDGKIAIWTIQADYNPVGFAYGYRACEYGTNNFMVAFSGVSGAASENKDYYTEGTTSGDKIINNSGTTNNGKLINLIDGTFYDNSTDNWVVADTIQYNTENNNYSISVDNNTYNYYYTYNYTYNITIGATGQYTEIYNYFELPDGRNSYDLTAADIAPLSMEFDAVNYDKAAVDTHTKGLWHFDGDLSNSSYYQDYKLNWILGSSITYLESTNFNGCLYLDEAAHSLAFDFPSSWSGDDGFTLQFRYYVPPGGGPDMWFGLKWSSSSKSQFNVSDGYISLKRQTGYKLPVGQWSDIAFIGDGSDCFLYLNGILVDTASGGALPSGFQFQFQATAGTFCYIDELRIVDYPVYTENFTPTAVPYDTNNVFVLPEYEEGYSDDRPIVAIRSDLPVDKYQFGGVRPTFPDKGMVWFQVEDYVVKSTQQYTGTHWEEVGTRIWTGYRWIPLYSYDFTLSQDQWDNVDIPYQEGMITSPQGFYEWFKTEWVDFRNWLISAFNSLGSGTGSSGEAGTDNPVVVVPPDPDSGSDGVNLIQITTQGFGSIIDVLGGLFVTCFDGAIALTHSAMEGFTGVFADDGSVWQYYYYEGEDIWD
jgi:hypothetical protein